MDLIISSVAVKIEKIRRLRLVGIKGSSDSSHFVLEINVGKRRIRHTTTLNWNDNRFGVDLEINHLISASLYVGSDSFRP